MNPVKKFFLNCRRPEGLGGRMMLWSMNRFHSPMAEWGLRQIHVAADAHALDIGCGGGANLRRLLVMAPRGRACGLDYSPASVEKSRALNRTAIAAGRCEVVQGSVSMMPFDGDAFDVITAFETVYFWPDIKNDLREVCRVLKPRGTFLICNEMTAQDGDVAPEAAGFVKMLSMQVYTSDEYRRLLAQAGFHDVRIIQPKDARRLAVMAVK